MSEDSSTRFLYDFVFVSVSIFIYALIKSDNYKHVFMMYFTNSIPRMVSNTFIAVCVILLGAEMFLICVIAACYCKTNSHQMQKIQPSNEDILIKTDLQT